ncbi:MAG: hypothetical protein R3C05_26245 [Pirellulaceae bacterium]
MISFHHGDLEKAIADLEKHRIRFTDVVLVNSFDQKAEVIAERQVSYYIDDQPEMLKKHLSEDRRDVVRERGELRLRGQKVDAEQCDGEAGVGQIAFGIMAG